MNPTDLPLTCSINAVFYPSKKTLFWLYYVSFPRGEHVCLCGRLAFLTLAYKPHVNKTLLLVKLFLHVFWQSKLLPNCYCLKKDIIGR